MAEKKVYGWFNSLSVWSSRKKQKHLCSCIYEEGKKNKHLYILAQITH